MDKGIFVVASLHDDQLAPVSVEILGKARELADHFNEDLVALLIGDELDDVLKRLFIMELIRLLGCKIRSLLLIGLFLILGFWIRLLMSLILLLY